ncbi:MAG: hypothetical protein BWK76_02840 [Desulfobulbaceae bacterium A2]|nr:MAG: hypothetical protein BWK76_02840 [Desulfobulbaceae bacterium A2]
MHFHFTCPLRQKSFFSEDFQVIDNRGIALDEYGHKYLDASVRLTSPCPLCGELHCYRAAELSCPFLPGITSTPP